MCFVKFSSFFIIWLRHFLKTSFCLLRLLMILATGLSFSLSSLEISSELLLNSSVIFFFLLGITDPSPRTLLDVSLWYLTCLMMCSSNLEIVNLKLEIFSCFSDRVFLQPYKNFSALYFLFLSFRFLLQFGNLKISWQVGLLFGEFQGTQRLFSFNRKRYLFLHSLDILLGIEKVFGQTFDHKLSAIHTYFMESLFSLDLWFYFSSNYLSCKLRSPKPRLRVLNKFLEEHSPKKSTLIHLGCNFDDFFDHLDAMWVHENNSDDAS